MNFEDAFTRLVDPEHEGGYSNDANDSGGETMYGVTIAVARANGYQGDMRELPLETAKQIYQAKYWTPVRCDELPDAVRYEVFDMAVNMGTSTAAKVLQRALGVADDGVIGPATLAAAQAADTSGLLRKLYAQRLKSYTSMMSWPSFGKGWVNRVATNMLEA